MSNLTPKNSPRSPFDEIRHEDINPDGSVFEWWSGREALVLLGYSNWQAMKKVIERAKAACRNTGDSINQNFIDTNKVPSQTGPAQEDMHLTRYAMYLVAMNGDPSKRQIAAAQRYFAIQTRRAELQLPPPVAPTIPVVPATHLLPDLRPWQIRVKSTFMPHQRWLNSNYPLHFTVVSELAIYVIQMEDDVIHHQMVTDSTDRPDISIGLRWSKYRRITLGLQEVESVAPLYLPDQSIEVELKLYPESERNQFRKWFFKVYIPENYIAYVDGKPQWKSVATVTRASLADYTSMGIAGVPAVLPAPRRAALALAGGFCPAIGPAEHKKLPPRG